jgi:hypothetical protein
MPTTNHLPLITYKITRTDRRGGMFGVEISRTYPGELPIPAGPYAREKFLGYGDDDTQVGDYETRLPDTFYHNHV